MRAAQDIEETTYDYGDGRWYNASGRVGDIIVNSGYMRTKRGARARLVRILVKMQSDVWELLA